MSSPSSIILPVFHSDTELVIDEEIKSNDNNLDAYEIDSAIGSGSYSTVYRALKRSTNESVAIKVIDVDKIDVNFDDISHEISIVHQIQHPNIIKIFNSFIDRESLYIVMPLFTRGSLKDVVHNQFSDGIKDEVLIASILKQILLGLQYCHNQALIHRDVKPDNILVGDDGNIILGDFGITCELQSNGNRRKYRNTFTGSPCYMAPEIFQSENGYDQEVDIWAFGISALFLAHGKTPFENYQPMKIMLEVLQNDPPTLIDYSFTHPWSNNFRDMILKCLVKEPTKRIKMDRLLKHGFLKKAQDIEYIKKHIVN